MLLDAWARCVRMRRALTNAPLPQVLRTSAFVIGAAYGMIRMPMRLNSFSFSLSGIYPLGFPVANQWVRFRATSMGWCQT